MKEMMNAWMKVLGADVFFHTEGDEFYVTFNDFAGFNDEWDEIHRDYTNPNAVRGFIDWLEMNASDKENGYIFADDFKVFTDFASDDI